MTSDRDRSCNNPRSDGTFKVASVRRRPEQGWTGRCKLECISRACRSGILVKKVAYLGRGSAAEDKTNNIFNNNVAKTGHYRPACENSKHKFFARILEVSHPPVITSNFCGWKFQLRSLWHVKCVPVVAARRQLLVIATRFFLMYASDQRREKIIGTRCNFEIYCENAGSFLGTSRSPRGKHE